MAARLTLSTGSAALLSLVLLHCGGDDPGAALFRGAGGAAAAAGAQAGFVGAEGGSDGEGGQGSGGEGEGGQGGAKGPCCEPGGEALGCADADVEACVCAVDPACCEQSWSDLCVAEVGLLGCGACEGQPFGGSGGAGGEPFGGGPEGGGSDGEGGAAGAAGEGPGGEGGAPAGGNCCQETPGVTGCADQAIEQCVCAQDDFCCTTEWDAKCISQVSSFGCSTKCGGDPPVGGAGGKAGGGQGGAPPGGGCCQEQFFAGCEVKAVESCVCADDAYCCETAWDDQCVGKVESLNCGACP